MECLEDNGHEKRVQQDRHDGPDQRGVNDPPGGKEVPGKETGKGIEKDAEPDKLFRIPVYIIFNVKQRDEADKEKPGKPSFGPGKR